MHDKLAALKPRLHFPRVIGVFALRSVHCCTGTVQGHRRRLLGTAGKTKPERLALGSSLSLQPYIHAENYPTIVNGQVYLVNARETKNLPGRKSDVQESQWLMKRRCESPPPSAVWSSASTFTNRQLRRPIHLQPSADWRSAPNFGLQTPPGRCHFRTPASTPSAVLTRSTYYGHSPGCKGKS
jgi:hypothetical protein